MARSDSCRLLLILQLLLMIPLAAWSHDASDSSSSGLGPGPAPGPTPTVPLRKRHSPPPAYLSSFEQTYSVWSLVWGFSINATIGILCLLVFGWIRLTSVYGSKLYRPRQLLMVRMQGPEVGVLYIEGGC